MSTTTTNLGLFKYDVTMDANVPFNINNALNNNWDRLDAIDREITTLTNGTISLIRNKTLYKYDVSGNTTFTFSITDLSLDTTCAYTFELLLKMTTIYTLTFPSTVSWQNNITPNMSSTGNYFFVFRTTDGGENWFGNLQGVW